MFSRSRAQKQRRPSQERRRQQRLRAVQRTLSIEPLEARQLLTANVVPHVTINGADIAVQFDVPSDYKGDVYLRMNHANGAVEWGTDGTTYEAFAETFTDKSSASFSLSYDATADALANFGFDLFNSLVIGNFSLPGVNTSFSSLQIDVQAGATISTAAAVGTSGNLLIQSPRFATGSGVSIITDHVLGTDTPGNLTIEARGTLGTVVSLFGGTLPFLPSTANTKAEVTLTNTTIRAGNVIVESTSDSADQYDDQDESSDGNLGLQIVEGVSDFIGSISAYGGFAISQADASFTMDGGTIEAANLSVSSTALTKAQTTVLSNKVGAAGLAISEPKAVINVQNGAVIHTLGDVSLRSNAESTASVSALLRAKEKGGTLALGFADLTSQAIVSSNSIISAGGSFTANSDATGSPIRTPSLSNCWIPIRD